MLLNMFSKKKVLLILVVILAVSVSFVLYRSYRNQTEEKVSVPTTGAQYKDFTPGVSTEANVVKKLGTAISEKQEGDTKILEYKSNNPNFNNQFSSKQGTLIFVKQIVTIDEKINISDINKEYGNYEKVLYGPFSTNGFDLYIYPDKGIAYIGHQGSGIILEIWYFPPTDLKTFKNLYAQDYLETLPVVQ